MTPQILYRNAMFFGALSGVRVCVAVLCGTISISCGTTGVFCTFTGRDHSVDNALVGLLLLAGAAALCCTKGQVHHKITYTKRVVPGLLFK
jgi:hypothetical protein